MRAQIVYDKPCRIRFRCGSNAFTKELERSIHKLVMSNPWAIACEAHYENGGILIRYKEGHRAEAVELVRKLRGSDLAPVSDNQYDIEEIDRTFKSDLAKLVMQRYIRKAVLPAPIGAALIVYSGLKYIAKGVSALFDGKLTVEVLDGSSISACLIQKNYNTAGTVMFLLSVSGLLEDYTRARTRAALTDSLAIKADQVWLAGKDADTLIPMSQLQVDDCIRVRTGSVIPVDGQITEGEAYINEASMTGEPLAVMKSAGASVFAGTVVEEGSVVIKVRKLSSDTKISKIIELIDNSENLKAGVQSKAERLADSIVPYSFLAFGLTLLFTRNVTKAVSVLMVDYSCAIKLSTPIAVISAIKEAADDDVTIKGGKYLEEYALADSIVFDKTGTLTNAEPVLEKVIALGDYSEAETLKIAACLEEHFPHSVARAIVKGAADRDIDHAEEHAEVQYIVAHGISTTLHGKRAIIGSRHFVCEDEGIEITDEQQAEIDEKSGACSVVYLAVGNKLTGALCISDPPRPEAEEAVKQLKEAGITNIIMLTGDSAKAAEITAQKLGISDFRAQVLPEDKHRYVQQLKEHGHRVIMVGDGINDAPALAAANVSVAMSDASDIAKETADITVRGADLTQLAAIRQLSEKLMQRINSNYRFILLFNSVLLLSGAFGLLQPSASALLHNASTMAICAKSMTPLEDKKRKKKNK
ncbi:heavy metal translocating P-type ATPase [Ruminococcus sp. AM31-15AC]|uniref:heavy metal translocating P-type ATPase n=1 Tax=Ruminococcus sp. AM31-15AC TaxID=2293202 RepID=UPI000E4F24D0|nr:heavy metal translocating P-type ATPase [Ruminococcus sp. AM31-15AC]